MKKSLSVLLCLLLVFSMISGCAVSQTPDQDKTTVSTTNAKEEGEKAESSVPAYLNATGLPITKDKVTVKVMGLKMPLNGPWEEMVMLNKISRLTNINFEYDAVPQVNYLEKKNLTFASGDLPDIFIRGNLTVQDEDMYGPQKLLVEMDELIEKYMPNLTKMFEDHKDVRNVSTASDGHIYAIPSLVLTTTILGNICWINEEWLNRLDLKMPKTTQEFYEVLTSFRDNDPNQNGLKDEIPLGACLTSDIPRSVVLPAFGLKGEEFWIDESNGTAVFTPGEDNYKEYLKFMNKLYTEKLLDNEYFTQTHEQLRAKGKEGILGMVREPQNMLQTTGYDMYVLMEPMTSEVNDEKIVVQNNWVDGYSCTTGAFAITNKCKYPEAMARMADYFYGEHTGDEDDISGLSMWMGEYGIDWEYEDDTKTAVIRNSRDPNLSFSESVYKNVTPMQGGGGAPGKIVTLAIIKGNFWQEIKAKESPEKFFPHVVTNPIGYLRISPEDLTQRSMMQNDIDTYVDMMYAKFVTGEESFDNWDNYLTKLNQLGVEKLKKMYEDAYKSWMD